MKKQVLSAIALMASSTGVVSAQELGSQDCDSLVLVSSWFNNSVKIYDGCNGEFVRDLDTSGIIQGPQKIVEMPDGDILVVSENNATLIKYDRETLSQSETLISNAGGNFVATPVAAEYADNGDLYVASYSQNKVVVVDTNSWTVKDTLLEANNGLIQGADSGIAVNDGYLYVPGYDSDNIIRINIQTKAAETFIGAGTQGMDAPRGIVFVNDRMLVTSERSNSILEFNPTNGSFVQSLYSSLRPAGLVLDGDSHIMFTTREAVFRGHLDGSGTERLVRDNEGGLSGATNALRITKTGGDSDGDGISDEDETAIHGTDPQNPDSDADGLTDGEEINEYNTNPLNADSDADLMPDGYEVQNNLNPLVDDASLDGDEDGLSNLAEYQMGTDPNDSDTDNDGLLDGEDNNPLVSDAMPVLSGSPDLAVQQDQTYLFEPELEYTGVMDAISFGIENKPEWATFSEESGVLTGRPTNDDVGVYSDIVISSTDGQNSDSIPSFSIEVVNVNDAPELVSSNGLDNITLTAGNALSRNLASQFVDIDAEDILSFIGEGFPAEFTLTEQGSFTGTAATVGTHTVTITATDSSDASVQASFVLTINEPIIVDPPEPESNSSSGGSVFWTGLLALVGLMRKRKSVH